MSETTTTRGIGNQGEDFVCDRLRERGLRIIERNVRAKFAEIDIVAEDGDVLCFIEVRTRRTTELGHPLETITVKKQRAVRRAAELFLCRHPGPARPIRFDVATVVWSSMEFTYLKDAF